MSPPADELSTTFRVMMVCTGNICRSPMAEAVLADAIATSDLARRVIVDSSGTHSYHVGASADPRAAAVLAQGGVSLEHEGRRFDSDWIGDRNLILAMDQGHLKILRELAADRGTESSHIRLFREFDPDGPGDVPDPYYDSITEFADVLQILQRTMPPLMQFIRDRLG